MTAATLPTSPTALRFPRRLRLVHQRQFQAVYAARQRHASGPLAFTAKPNDLPHCRLGLAVPRKVGTAVRRNRIKRLLREAFRLQQHDLPPGFDVVINVRPHAPLTLADYEQILLKSVRVLAERRQQKKSTDA
jgi:ribonuclease P protein component